MAKKFADLRKKMSPAARQKAEALTKEMLVEMPLQELRQARLFSQEQLANALGVKQASVSKLEHRTDMYVQTLRSYIEAMGGELNITARFPDGEIRINLFEDIDSRKTERESSRRSGS